MSKSTCSIPVRAGLALLLAWSAVAHAAPAYRAHEVLGPADGPPVTPTAMNNKGRVAGYVNDPADWRLRKSFTLKASGAYKEFEAFDSDNTTTDGMNDLGDTVGYAMHSPGDMAFFKPAGQPAIALFPTDGEVASYAWAVNASGMVVGNFVKADDRQYAFSWKDGVVTELPSLGGRRSYAGSVNASGVIAGGSLRKARWGEIVHFHAVKWVDGVLIELPGLGYTDVTGDGAHAVNDAGWVAGYCAAANFQSHGCIWHDGVVDDLPPLVEGSWGLIRSINNSNVAVGRAGYPATTGHAVIWKNGVISDLNQQAQLPVGLSLETALTINDKGQILAYGYDSMEQRTRYFVLVPQSAD